MKILYVCHRVPYPPNKGDKIRSFNQIRYLSKSHTLDLVCLADDPTDLQHKTVLESYCRTLTVIPLKKMPPRLRALKALFSGRSLSVAHFYEKRLQSAVDALLRRNSYDAVLYFSSTMAEYLFRSGSLGSHRKSSGDLSSSQHLGNPRLVMDLCDVDSYKWAQYARESFFPLNLIYRTEAHRLLEYEKSINKFFNDSIFVSRPEADLFLSLFPEARNVHVVANGVDHQYFSPDSRLSALSNLAGDSSPLLLFTGAMDYHANEEGVSWFCSQIFPLIRDTYPTARFCIVGSNPSRRVRNLAEIEGVTVTGFVEDIRPYYQAADVCVVPLRVARGIQNKVLEAMAMQKAVVTTTAAIEGIGAVVGEQVFVDDEERGFGDHVISLIGDATARYKMGQLARGFVVNNFDWGSNVLKLEHILKS